MKRWLSLLLALALALALAACSGRTPSAPVAPPPAAELTLLPSDNASETIAAPSTETDVAEANAPPAEAPVEPIQPAETPVAPAPDEAQAPDEPTLPEDGVYDSKEDVALYLHLYGHLPDNYITKKDAEALGWSGGSLEPYAPGKCIGGSRFGNYEGLLPAASGRKYTECDIDTLGAKSRGAKRIVFSNDGLIYYTGDHYQTFELLYGEEQT